jgi:glycerol kinase
MFAQCCFEPGEAKATYGTGSFVLMNTGSEPVISNHGLLTTIAFAWQVEGESELNVTYALEGSVYSAGSTLQWLRDGLQMYRHVSETERIARSVDDSGGVFLVPAFNGLGAPHWDSDARGMLTGLTQGTRNEHIVRAALESIAFSVADVLEAMAEDSGIAISELRVDGGVSQNDFVMQLQADILGVDVVRPAMIEATALGSAFVAGIATGFWDDPSWFRQLMNRGKEEFVPAMDTERIAQLKEGWQSAVRRAQG